MAEMAVNRVPLLSKLYIIVSGAADRTDFFYAPNILIYRQHTGYTSLRQRFVDNIRFGCSCLPQERIFYVVNHNRITTLFCHILFNPLASNPAPYHALMRVCRRRGNGCLPYNIVFLLTAHPLFFRLPPHKQI